MLQGSFFSELPNAKKRRFTKHEASACEKWSGHETRLAPGHHCSEPHPQNYHYCACVSARGAVYTVLYSLETQNLKMIPAARVFYPARPPALPVRPFSSGSTPLRSAPTFIYRFPQTYTHRLTAQLPLRSDGSTGREHRESSRTFARRGDFPDLPPFQSHPNKIVKSKRGKFRQMYVLFHTV